MSISTSNFGRRRDGSFEQYVPPSVVPVSGGGLDPSTPPGQPGELLLGTSATGGGALNNTTGYVVAGGINLPPGSWRAFGVADLGPAAGTVSIGVHTNMADPLALALVSATSPTLTTGMQVRTAAVTVDGGQMVVLKAETTAPLPGVTGQFTLLAQRLS